jgi:NAD(P)-dependent dehydrogenase (short-subunit alcohol dehydrogenase family)
VGPRAGHSASKAVAHSITQALRAELRDRGITVLGAYPGGIDTDMLAGGRRAQGAARDRGRTHHRQPGRRTHRRVPGDASASAGSAYVSERFGVSLEPGDVLRRRARGGSPMHVMAAGEELVRHLVATEADPLGEDNALMVLARAGALALVNRVETAGTP